MSLIRHSTEFGHGRIAYVGSYRVASVNGQAPYTVTLLLKVDSERFGLFRWGFAALGEVFELNQLSWVGPYTAIVTIRLDSSLRNPRSFVRSFAERLKHAFAVAEQVYRKEQEMWEQHYSEDEDLDPEEYCECSHSVWE